MNDDLTYSRIMLNGLNSGDDDKVLGIAWDRKSDSLKFDLRKVVEDVNFDHVTDRTILSTTAKFYDPLAIISPIIIPLKLLFQDVCKLTDVEWDSELDNTIVGRFKEIIDDIRATGIIELKWRYYEDLNNATSVQIHAFGDASEVAYGTAIYLRAETPDETKVELVATKNSVAPIKLESMPRFELLSALVISQLVNKVQEVLSPVLTIHDTYCFLDSQCALYWILGVTKELKTFVDNRVKEIRKLAHPEMWNYVNTNDYQEDITSPGCKASKLKESELWFHDPKFLRQSSELWPKDFEMLLEMEL